MNIELQKSWLELKKTFKLQHNHSSIKMDLGIKNQPISYVHIN